MQFSRTTTERINAADLMRLRLEEQIEKADSDRAEAKRARDESEDALLDAIGESRQEIAEAEEELKGTPKDNDEAQRPILRKLERIKTACTEQVMKLEADFRRRDEKFQVCDREARSLKKQQKDIVERVLQLIADAREGSSLFENPEEQAALGTSWRDVHIADLMGDAFPELKKDVHAVAELIREEEGIRTYRMERPDSPLLVFKGVCVIDAPVDRVLSVCLDAERADEWIGLVSESRVLRWIDGDRAYVQLTRFDLPWPVRDRAFVSSKSRSTPRRSRRRSCTARAPISSRSRGPSSAARMARPSVSSRSTVAPGPTSRASASPTREARFRRGSSTGRAGPCRIEA